MGKVGYCTLRRTRKVSTVLKVEAQLCRYFGRGLAPDRPLERVVGRHAS
jgi:hypothetical protein